MKRPSWALGFCLWAGCAGLRGGLPVAPPPDEPVGPAPPAHATTAVEVQPPVDARITPDASFRLTPPAPGPERPFTLPETKRFVLESGLPVILVESRRLPLVGIELVIKTGGAANPPGKPGLAELVADMLDEGTTGRSAVQIADELAALGARLSTDAGWDTSSVAVAGLSEHLDPMVAVWADVVLRPAFDEDQRRRVQQAAQAAITRRKDSPAAVAAVTFARALYGEAHPYGWPAGGTPKSLDAIQSADLRRFHETYFRPNNAVLVVAGDIDEDDVRTRIAPLLRDFKPARVPRVMPPRPRPPDRTKVYLVDRPGAPRSALRLGLVGIERKSADYHRALVMNQILGGSFRRLDASLRERRGWAFAVSSLFEARRTPGPWSLQAELAPDQTGPAVEEIVDEIRRLRDDEVSDRELAEVKELLSVGLPARLATSGQVAGQLAALAVYDLPPDELQGFQAKIAAVTKDDVRKLARKILRPDGLVIVVVGDRKRIEGPLRRVADVELRDDDGAPVAAP